MNFTKDETRTINTLVRLGDSRELAEQTVVKARANKPNLNFYRNAYEN